MKNLNKPLLFTLTVLFLAACQDNTVPHATEEAYRTKTIESLNLSYKDNLKLKFGRAFAVAINESPELRKFVKEEALRMFNKDYDVLYHLVKNKPVQGTAFRSASGTYATLRDYMVSLFDNEDQLLEIENSLPLLTIFVPELPENSFSAHTWDVSDPAQIPVVAIRVDNTNEVPVVDHINQAEYVIEEDVIPGYPVVVIKSNERVMVVSGNQNPSEGSRTMNDEGDFSYRFIDDNFDNSLRWEDGGTGFGGDPIWSGQSSCQVPFIHIPGRQNNVAQFLVNAYNIFDGLVNQPWQRDNIYYQLTPQQTTNTYVGGRYTEAVTYFRLQGDPTTVFNSISNHFHGSNPDPNRANQDWSRDKRVPWTDGNFEIGFSITDNARNRPNINARLVFDAKPGDLFTFTYETTRRGIWPFRRDYYKPVITGFKGMDFTSLSLNATRLHIHAWDLTEYSNVWNYEVSEIDATTEISISTTNERKYNTNVGVDLSIPLGDKVKLGLKFGSSSEEKLSTTRTLKWFEGSDYLGDFDVAFGDAILLKNPCNEQLYPRLYSTSRLMVEIRPVQVQF